MIVNLLVTSFYKSNLSTTLRGFADSQRLKKIARARMVEQPYANTFPSLSYVSETMNERNMEGELILGLDWRRRCTRDSRYQKRKMGP
jgi:hypothetical protein